MPIYGPIIGEYEGDEPPTGLYTLKNGVSVIVTPDGKVGMAKIAEIFGINEIKTNTPYTVIEEPNKLYNLYYQQFNKIVQPERKILV